MWDNSISLNCVCYTS